MNGIWACGMIFFFNKKKSFFVDYGIKRSNFYNSFSVGTDYV